MGLLDMFGTSFDDPRTGATLQLAQGLLSSPRVMQGLAGGLSGYQQAMAQAKQAKMVEEMRQMQMAQQKAQMEAAQRQQAQSEVDRLGLSELIGGPINVQGMLQRGMSPQAIQQAAQLAQINKPEGPMITKAGDVARDPKTGQVIWQNDDKESVDPFIRLLKQSGIDPMSAQGQQLLQAKLRKDTTHTPPVNVSYGAPVAGVDAGGNPVFFQPSKDGGAPAIIPGVAPSKDKNYTEDQAKAAGWLAQANNAYGNMLASMKDATGKKTGAEKPEIGDMIAGVPMLGAVGNMMRTENRQKFVQASSSLSEALLRAATGAGVNADEARQKVAELTPQFGEDAATTAQKMASIPVYIESLKVRAGPLARKPSEPAKPSAPAGISLDAIEAEIARRRAARGG